jgi:hypothetical protein
MTKKIANKPQPKPKPKPQPKPKPKPKPQSKQQSKPKQKGGDGSINFISNALLSWSPLI